MNTFSNYNNCFYSTAQIKDLEHRLIEHRGLSQFDLMQRAASAAWAECQKIQSPISKLVCVVGKGNNAGDALVLAALAHKVNVPVTVYLLHSPDTFKGTAAKAYQFAKDAGVHCTAFKPEGLEESSLIVDGLLGTGLNGEPSEKYAKAIDAINATKVPVVALDVPSGLNADTGSAPGAVIKAVRTITFIGYKIGLFTGAGPSHCGAVLLDTLGAAEEDFEHIDEPVYKVNRAQLNQALPERKRSAHKGRYGHVLVIGGNYGMGGAVCLAAAASARVGAGLVSVATRPEHMAIVMGTQPGLMCHGVEEATELHELLQKATVVVAGPGLGTDAWAEDLLMAVLQSQKPMVIDADALNLLSKMTRKNNRWILTPHPGEASRLLGKSIDEIQANRLQAVRALQYKYGGVSILKGAGSLIFDDETTHLCTAGNPGMASAGMGDVLTGVIGGLVAQGLSHADAAKLGVFVHASAADLAACEGGERGMIATDLLDYLRRLVNLSDD